MKHNLQGENTKSEALFALSGIIGFVIPIILIFIINIADTNDVIQNFYQDATLWHRTLEFCVSIAFKIGFLLFILGLIIEKRRRLHIWYLWVLGILWVISILLVLLAQMNTARL